MLSSTLCSGRPIFKLHVPCAFLVFAIIATGPLNCAFFIHCPLGPVQIPTLFRMYVLCKTTNCRQRKHLLNNSNHSYTFRLIIINSCVLGQFVRIFAPKMQRHELYESYINCLIYFRKGWENLFSFRKSNPVYTNGNKILFANHSTCLANRG
jgi:hypothetical protein